MEKIIDDLVKIQEGRLSEGTVKSYDELKNMNLSNLYNMIKEPNENNLFLISTVGTTLDFGTINGRLTDCEYNEINNVITSQEDYERLKKLILLFEELSNYLKPHLKKHLMIQEIKLLNNMLLLAQEQDRTLENVINSIQTSSLIHLPTDDKKRNLIRLYREIKNFKTVADLQMFYGTICPEIKFHAQHNQILASIQSLFGYTIGKTRTLANTDSNIRQLYLMCNMEMLSIKSNEKEEYREVTNSIDKSYDEYVGIVKSLKKYQNPKYPSGLI